MPAVHALQEEVLWPLGGQNRTRSRPSIAHLSRYALGSEPFVTTAALAPLLHPAPWAPPTSHHSPRMAPDRWGRLAGPPFPVRDGAETW